MGNLSLKNSINTTEQGGNEVVDSSSSCYIKYESYTDLESRNIITAHFFTYGKVSLPTDILNLLSGRLTNEEYDYVINTLDSSEISIAYCRKYVNDMQNFNLYYDYYIENVIAMGKGDLYILVKKRYGNYLKFRYFEIKDGKASEIANNSTFELKNS
jgi:hypothetical protein